MAHDSLLEIKNLMTHFHLQEGIVRAVDGVSFDVRRGQTLGIIGESGCGKSVTAHSILRLVPSPPGNIVNGEILLYRGENGENGGLVDLAQLDPRGAEIRAIRGAEISMVFQEPMTSFGPMHTIGNQIIESILLHQEGVNKTDAHELAIENLRRVGIPRAPQIVDSFPHQLSGGMRQRAMIAMALSCSPRLLIADEPTTAVGCNDSGSDLGADEGLAGGVWHGRHLHHAQFGRDRRSRRCSGRDVFGPHRRAGGRKRAFPTTRNILTRRGCWIRFPTLTRRN